MKLYRCSATLVTCMLAFLQAGIAQAAPQTPAPAAASDHNLQTETIHDSTLDMKAFTVNIPLGWKFQGTVIADVGCNPPSPVFRAYSPDGLTEIRLMPLFRWAIQKKSSSSREGLPQNSDCIYLNGPMTAAQFLDRYVRALGAPHVAGPMSISAGYQKQLDDLASRMKAIQSKDPNMRMHFTQDAAAVRIETMNGTFIIEQRLRAHVICTRWPNTADRLGSCSARIDVLRAPKGQLDALANNVDSHNLTTARSDDLWVHRITEELSGEIKHFDPYVPNQAAMRMLYRQARDFALLPSSWEETRDFTPMALRYATRNEDWADFALAPKPKQGPNGTVTGESGLRTWTSSDGQHYETRNPGANPNGVLAGQWTEGIVSEISGPQ